MAVQIVEIDATTPVKVIDLPEPFAAKIRVMGDTRGSDAGKCGIELSFADQEGVVLGAEVCRVGKIEGDPVAGTNWDEMAPLGSGFQVQNVSKELGGCPFVPRRDYCVVQLYAHRSSPFDNAHRPDAAITSRA